MKIGRNDPCPCGSGKKYKKCCGNKKVVDLSGTILKEELDQLYFRFEEYVAEYYPLLLPPEESSGELDRFKAHMDMMERTVFEKNGQQGQSIMQEYVDRVAKDISRPMTKQSVEAWPESVPGLFTLTERTSDHSVQMKQEWTDETYDVRESTIAQGIQDSETYYFGVLMKWGREYLFVPGALSMVPEAFDKFSSIVEKEYKASKSRKSIVAFFASRFTHYVDVLFHLELEQDTDISEVWNGSDKEREVLRLLEEHLAPEAKQGEAFEHMQVIWMYYCDHYSPTIRKPEVFAAALEYFYRESPFTGSSLPSATQKELAKKYGVSPNSISRRFDDLEEVFFDMVEKSGGMEQSPSPQMAIPTFPSWEVAAERVSYEMNFRLSNKSFSSINEMEQFIQSNENQPFTPETDEQKAQLLAYDAYQSDSLEQREKLVEEALQLDPGSVDARVLKASLEEETTKKLLLLLSACNDVLRDGWLDTSEGDLWRDVFARPFMRAQELLAAVYAEKKEYKEAIHYYEGLLEYNENDNQGIREKLFPLYIQTGQEGNAHRLLEKYEDNGTWNMYSDVLLAIIAQLPGDILQEWVMEAEQTNPYVIPYLLGEKTWTNLPESYRPGTEEEAIVYAYRNANAWESHKKELVRFR